MRSHLKTKLLQQARPLINVTPLIDVLLVLLIIFMVLTPLRPTRFKALVPGEPPSQDQPMAPHPLTLVVTIESDRHLKLNDIEGLGSVNDPSRMVEALAEILRQREKNHTYRADALNALQTPEADRIEKTVFIKAPRSLDYGEVARVIDEVKGTGAQPIGLQIDELQP